MDKLIIKVGVAPEASHAGNDSKCLIDESVVLYDTREFDYSHLPSI